MDLFDLQSKIGLDSESFKDGLAAASDNFHNFGDKIKTGLSNVGNIAMGAVNAVANGVTNITNSIVSSSQELANYGDSIDKASQKIGVSASFYQEWEAVLQHSGTSMSNMTATFKTLANASQSATDDQAAAFQKLGLSMDQLSSMSAEDIFKNVVSGLQNMEESTERTAIATTLLGKGAMELGPLLNTSAEDTQGMIDAVNNLGGVMSDEAVKASATFNDQLQDMTTAIDGVKRGITAEFLPGLSTLMGGFTKLISGTEGATDELKEGFNSIGDALKNSITKIADVARTLVPAIARAIMQLLPTIADISVDILETISGGISNNLPEIVNMALVIIRNLVNGILKVLPELTTSAVDIIFALADGIVDMLPTILETAVIIIDTLVDKLTAGDMLNKLIDTSIVLIITLTDALIDNLPVLIEKAPVIVERLVDAIVTNAPKILSAAWELIQKLIKGIDDVMPDVLTSGKRVLNTFVDGVKNLFTNLVPLGADIINKVGDGISKAIDSAKTWGKDMIDNFIGGIKEKWENLKDTVSGVAQTVKDFLGFSEPKEGPLSNFHTYAPDMIDLFNEGIKKSENKLKTQLSYTADVIGDSFTDLSDMKYSITVNKTESVREYNYNNTEYSNINNNERRSFDNTERSGLKIERNTHNPERNIINYNITVTAGTISNDYDARRAAVKISESLASLQTAQRYALGG